MQDDISLPARFAVQAAFLGVHPEVVAVGGQAIEIDDEEGNRVRVLRKFVKHEEIEATLIGRTIKPEGGIVHPSAMIRHEALRKVGGYRAEFEPAEDRDLWLRLAEVGRLANVREVVLKYRVHPKSVSLSRAATQHEKARRAIQEAHSRRGWTLPQVIEMWSLVDRPLNRVGVAGRSGIIGCAERVLPGRA